MEIVCDSKSDFRLFCRKIIALWGIDDGKVNENDIEMMFWRMLYRVPAPMPREIVRASQFCCPPTLKESLNQLEERIKNGESLYPFLSKRAKKITDDSGFEDDLLSDWGIHHFHLGKYENDDFSERTDKLLFAMVNNDKFYEIAILPHKQWNNKQLLETISSNWPDLLKSYVPPMTTDDSPQPVREILRNGHVMTIIRLSSGRCVFSSGGGYATDGTPCIVTENYDRMSKILRSAEKKVKDESGNFWCNIPKKDLYTKINVNFIFRLEDIFDPEIVVKCYD